MNFKEYRKKLQQDPEYIAAEKELKPLLDLADRVLDLRLEKGWSQAELAQRVGTKQANISRIESGLANPTVKFLQKLAQAFGVELEVRLCSEQPERAQVLHIPMTKTIWPREKRSDGEIVWNIQSETDILSANRIREFGIRDLAGFYTRIPAKSSTPISQNQSAPVLYYRYAEDKT